MLSQCAPIIIPVDHHVLAQIAPWKGAPYRKIECLYNYPAPKQTHRIGKMLDYFRSFIIEHVVFTSLNAHTFSAKH